VQQASIIANHNFQPCQIVFLEHENARLYAEVIQVVTARQICWVRPLMLAVFGGDRAELLHLWQGAPTEPTLHDLRESADLLWPANLFQPALDTEVIPLISQLSDLDGNSSVAARLAHQHLSHFVRQVWQAHQSDFG
jgi:hypothetical protein